MRTWRVAIVLTALLVALPGGALVAAQGGDLEQRAAEPRAVDGWVPVAAYLYLQPEPEAEAYEIEAILFVAREDGNPDRAVRCPFVGAQRLGAKTTVGAFCEARKPARGVRAALRVWVYGANGRVKDSCVDGRRLRQESYFQCSVRLPSP